MKLQIQKFVLLAEAHSKGKKDSYGGSVSIASKAGVECLTAKIPDDKALL